MNNFVLEGKKMYFSLVQFSTNQFGIIKKLPYLKRRAVVYRPLLLFNNLFVEVLIYEFFQFLLFDIFEIFNGFYFQFHGCIVVANNHSFGMKLQR